MIESSSFGQMVILGRRYGSDLIVYPDGRIQDHWWRKSGHRLTVDDIRELILSRPEVIIAGTGVSAGMVPEKALKKYLRLQEIAFIAEPTAHAAKLFNNIRRKQRTGACFHLTC